MNIRAFGRLLFSGFALPKFAFRESNFLPEPKPKSLFEALRSKRFVRRIGIGLVLVMGTTFAALQANAVGELGEGSSVDYSANTQSVMYANHANALEPTGTNSFTVQAWVKPSASAASGSSSDFVVLTKHHKYVIVSTSGRWQYYVGNAGAWVPTRLDTGVDVKAGVWTHLSLVLTSDNTYFYVDGQLVHTRGSRYDSGGNGSSQLVFGSWVSSSSATFVGEIDEVKLWSSDRRASLESDMHSRPSVGAAGLEVSICPSLYIPK